MLQWFFRFSEFAEFTEFNESCDTFRKNASTMILIGHCKLYRKTSSTSDTAEWSNKMSFETELIQNGGYFTLRKHNLSYKLFIERKTRRTRQSWWLFCCLVWDMRGSNRLKKNIANKWYLHSYCELYGLMEFVQK